MAVSQVMPGSNRPDSAVVTTVEESLHHAHDDLRLLADLFELQAATENAPELALSQASASALHRMCRRVGDDLRRLLDVLPNDALNRSMEAPTKRR